MQSVSSKIWTRVTVSISYGDNHYTTGTSKIIIIIITIIIITLHYLFIHHQVLFQQDI